MELDAIFGWSKYLLTHVARFLSKMLINFQIRVAAIWDFQLAAIAAKELAQNRKLQIYMTSKKEDTLLKGVYNSV